MPQAGCVLTGRQPGMFDCRRMGIARSLANAWAGAALIGAMALISTTVKSDSGAPTANLRTWRQSYHRPADIPFPNDDPYSRAKTKLGRMLFFDPLLSGAKVRSCASCHNPGLSWGDGQPLAMGEEQKPLPLRTPTLLNVAWIPKLGWDGHFRNLETVAMGPITANENMNLSEAAMIARLAAIPGYVDAFQAAFSSSQITGDKIEMALATFERTIVSTEAPFDRWIGGD